MSEPQLFGKRGLGRPRKLRMPPLPAKLVEGLSQLERDHLGYFVEAYLEDYPDLSETDKIALHLAALEYINLIRLQEDQIGNRNLVSQVKQHPGVQLRAWLQLLHATRKDRISKLPTETDKEREFFLSLSK